MWQDLIGSVKSCRQRETATEIKWLFASSSSLSRSLAVAGSPLLRVLVLPRVRWRQDGKKFRRRTRNFRFSSKAEAEIVLAQMWVTRFRVHQLNLEPEKTILLPVMRLEVYNRMQNLALICFVLHNFGTRTQAMTLLVVKSGLKLKVD